MPQTLSNTIGVVAPSPIWVSASSLFQNGFVNVSSVDATYQDVQFCLNQGFVEIRGACYKVWPFATNTVIFNLPSVYRPLKRVTLYAPSNVNSDTSDNFRIDLLANGDLVVVFTSATPPASGACFALFNTRFAPN